MAAVTIHDHELDSDTHNLYDVVIHLEPVRTLVTNCPSKVSSWISDVEQIHRHRLRRLIVGLDVEWRPSFSRHHQNPVAILQLCVGRRCLIFQLLHADSIPASLSAFLDHAHYTFVGLGIAADAEKLAEDHGLAVRNAVDLGDLAAREYDDPGMKNRGLKDLARIVHGMEIEKPKSVTMGRWDNRWLNWDQVQYACVDAFVSFQIGKKLITGS